MRRAHTCTFSRDLVAQSRIIRDPRPVSNENRSRASYTVTGALIEGGFSPPHGKSLFCQTIAPIRRGFTLSGIKVEKDRAVSLSSDLRLNLATLFRSFPFLSLNFSLSHTVGSSLLVRRAISSECISRLRISRANIYTAANIFVRNVRIERTRQFHPTHPISFYNEVYLNLIITRRHEVFAFVIEDLLFRKLMFT